MAIGARIICDHDGLLVDVEGAYLACGGKVYVFVCCIEAIDASFDSAAYVVECVLALLR